nr:transposase family protein [Streptomyces sp. CT34]
MPPFKRHCGRELTIQQKAVNRARSRLRSPVERAFARLKRWRIFRKPRISPNRLTSMIQAVLTLERQRRRSSVNLFHPASGRVKCLVSGVGRRGRAARRWRAGITHHAASEGPCWLGILPRSTFRTSSSSTSPG